MYMCVYIYIYIYIMFKTFFRFTCRRWPAVCAPRSDTSRAYAFELSSVHDKHLHMDLSYKLRCVYTWPMHTLATRQSSYIQVHVWRCSSHDYPLACEISIWTSAWISKLRCMYLWFVFLLARYSLRGQSSEYLLKTGFFQQILSTGTALKHRFTCGMCANTLAWVCVHSSM
jgi:hypothetical protein